MVQGVYVGAFFVGRRARRRYASLVRDVEIMARESETRRALLAEAHTEYRDALMVARQGILSGHTVGNYLLGALRERDCENEIYDGVNLDDGTAMKLRLGAGHSLSLEAPDATAAIVREPSGLGGLKVSGLTATAVSSADEPGFTLAEPDDDDGLSEPTLESPRLQSALKMRRFKSRLRSMTTKTPRGTRPIETN